MHSANSHQCSISSSSSKRITMDEECKTCELGAELNSTLTLDSKPCGCGGAISCPADNSELMWLEAAKLEHDYHGKIRVLCTGLVHYPKSTNLWNAIVEVNKEQDARLSLQRIIECCPNDVELWLEAAKHEKLYGTRESLDEFLRTAVMYVPQAEALWLMAAKQKCLAGDVSSARSILQEACAVIPNSEEIWLAASDLEFENREIETARMLLAKARERIVTEKVLMKSAIVERELGNISEERRLIDDGLERFPTFSELWLMLGQLHERFEEQGKAKEAYESGFKNCLNNCVSLCLAFAKLEEKITGLSKTREILRMGRERNPQNPEIWLESVIAERKVGNFEEADKLMAKALEECPKSGILWANKINTTYTASLYERKRMSRIAIAKCGQNDPYVIAAVNNLDRETSRRDRMLNRGSRRR